MVAMADEDFVDIFSSLGMPPTVAANIEPHLNDAVDRCILALYRSAVQPAIATVGKPFTTAISPNGLAMIGPNDHYAGTVEEMHHVATSVKANTATLADAGHWWICTHPEQAALILIEHWEQVKN